jgi:hypothetical protein
MKINFFFYKIKIKIEDVRRRRRRRRSRHIYEACELRKYVHTFRKSSSRLGIKSNNQSKHGDENATPSNSTNRTARRS